MNNQRTHTSATRSVLASLRSVIPNRETVTFTEALRIAELQANKLLELHALTDGPIPGQLITELPKIRIDNTDSLVSGASFWDTRNGVWVIQLSRADSWLRRRFTLAHEYKHIIDHGRRDSLYRGTARVSADMQGEHAADYFAGCLLVPRRLLKRAWGNGIQRPAELARLFQVSQQAIKVRLRQTGLIEDRARWSDRHGAYPQGVATPSTRKGFAPLKLEEMSA
ncbi:ImmA/IrrE family metallo-endopeptidase [Antrihabitans spumae]|jgi:Zn-dependent peptidase ImmA (M78 family)|uniref:ImmA/IrrE family metallo-endopeptidase n=1 Tax=Antrihabitans spumae TaxID=3373370 RepID=A0ABW7KFG6_9NOCA